MSDELHTRHFADLVMQQAGMAMIFMGVTPHPETGATMFDLDAAQHFIAQMEMLDAKTRGNLNTDEAILLKQSLSTARMAFVQAVERGAPAVAKEPRPAPYPPGEVSAETTVGETPVDDDERKKFVKKY